MPLECVRQARLGRAAAPPAEAERSDEELFLLVRDGDRDALGGLIRRHEQTLFGLLVHLTRGDASRADDLFQETFLRAVRSAHTFDPSRSFRTWLTAIAVNLVRDEARRKKVQNEVALQAREDEGGVRQLEAEEAGPEARAEANDEAARVRASLYQLTQKEREVVLLHFFEGQTLAEAATTLAIPVGTVKSRLHGALTRLKGVLER
ncbi:MAG: sigma-70 family RNA polymerase sigma factor [Planctomycetes bacterium]|nr:sigma-70 family RNA polymerase sigma factor [Planctomycetota bacterium]